MGLDSWRPAKTMIGEYIYEMKGTIQELRGDIAHLQQINAELAGNSYERGRDLEEINAILEDEIEYRRALEESNEMLNDQWFSFLMENQHLRTALEQARQEIDQVNDKLSFATEMVGALVLSDAYENEEDLG